MKKLFGLILGICATIMLVAQTNLYELDNVKANYLYLFTKYINWPDQIPADTFTIGLVGDTKPMKSNLEAIVKNKKIKDKPVKIEIYEEVANVNNANLLFVGNMDATNLQGLLKTLQSKPILTIGNTTLEDASFVHILLTEIDSELKFQLNETELEAANLEVDQKLIDLSVDFDKLFEEGLLENNGSLVNKK